MTLTLLVTIALGAVVGLVVGAFGGGGSLIAFPALVYVLGMSPVSAAAASLAVVSATSLTAAIAHARRGRVYPRVAAAFAAAGVAPSFFAAKASDNVSEQTLSVAFALLMTVIGLWMLCGPELAAAPGEAGSRPRLGLALVAGAGVGAVSGFLGVGGGFLIVPALVALMGLDLRAAIGTAPVVVVLNSVAGLVGHLGDHSIDLAVVSPFIVVASGSALVGARATRRVSVARLQRGFAALIVIIGVASLIADLS